ncbi:hypothetical protein BU666_10595, partial [Staphylococcus chromogenes]
MEYKSLKELANKIASGSTPRGGKNSYTDNGPIALIRSQNVYNNNFTRNGLAYINNEQAKKLKNVEIYKDDILINITGDSVARVAMVDSSVLPARVNQHVMIIRPEESKVNKYYLLAYLSSNIAQEILRQLASDGATRAALTKRDLENFKIPYLSFKTQEYIGDLLKYINKKIEINKNIIENLEELSQTLFKRWFVDFEFPNENGNPYKSSGGEMIDSELGNIPRDWEVNELGNYVDITKGLSYKGAFLDKQHERSDSFPLLSISNFNFISGFKSNKTKYYFGDYKERHLVNPGDILIAATDLTQDRKILGAPAIVPNLNKTMIFSLDVFKITETTIPKYVLYFLLQSAKYREFVEGSATGTTVIRIAKNVILKVPI